MGFSLGSFGGGGERGKGEKGGWEGWEDTTLHCIVELVYFVKEVSCI